MLARSANRSSSASLICKQAFASPSPSSTPFSWLMTSLRAMYRRSGSLERVRSRIGASTSVFMGARVAGKLSGTPQAAPSAPSPLVDGHGWCALCLAMRRQRNRARCEGEVGKRSPWSPPGPCGPGRPAAPPSQPHMGPVASGRPPSAGPIRDPHAASAGRVRFLRSFSHCRRAPAHRAGKRPFVASRRCMPPARTLRGATTNGYC